MTSPNDTAPKRTFFGWLRDMPTWKKLLLAGSTIAAVGSGVMLLTGNAHPTGGVAPGGGAGASLLPGSTGGTGSGTTEEPAAQGVFRLGFSFLAGFCLGSFLRAMIKVATIAIGFWLFMTFLLAWLGFMNVDWHAIQTAWDRFAQNIESEWGSFQRFVTGSLPAAGLGALGLAAGLKRH